MSFLPKNGSRWSNLQFYYYGPDSIFNWIFHDKISGWNIIQCSNSIIYVESIAVHSLGLTSKIWKIQPGNMQISKGCLRSDVILVSNQED